MEKENRHGAQRAHDDAGPPIARRGCRRSDLRPTRRPARGAARIPRSYAAWLGGAASGYPVRFPTRR